MLESRAIVSRNRLVHEHRQRPAGLVLQRYIGLLALLFGAFVHLEFALGNLRSCVEKPK